MSETPPEPRSFPTWLLVALLSPIACGLTYGAAIWLLSASAADAVLAIGLAGLFIASIGLLALIAADHLTENFDWESVDRQEEARERAARPLGPMSISNATDTDSNVRRQWQMYLRRVYNEFDSPEEASPRSTVLSYPTEAASPTHHGGSHRPGPAATSRRAA